MPGINKNSGNRIFYENIDLESFQGFAHQIGIGTGKDIEVLYKDCEKAESIAELGSGYGRVLHKLRTLGYANRLVGVERARAQVKHLENTFQDKVELLEEDILNLDPRSFKQDVILWMWSGIMEFDPEDQLLAIQKMYRCLNPGGKLFIELPYKKIHKVGAFTGEDTHRISFETKWGTLEAYLIDEEEMRDYATKAGADQFDKIVYQTDMGFERVIYVFTKNQ